MLIRCILLLQYFDVDIRDRKDLENLLAHHLSRMNNHMNSDELRTENAMEYEHLHKILDRDIWMRDVIRAIKGLLLSISARVQLRRRTIVEPKKFHSHTLFIW